MKSWTINHSMGTTALKNAGKLLAMLIAILALTSPLSAQADPPLPVNVSGYEFLLGTSCTINGQPGTCGVQFGGWTGGNGPVPNGWTPFPGTGQGLWKASVSYTGNAGLPGIVYLVSGSFDVLYTNGKTILGTVISGTVTWPNVGQSIGCGIEVAVVHADVTFRPGGPGVFQGCLHDLPAGTVLPPQIWGALQKNGQ